MAEGRQAQVEVREEERGEEEEEREEERGRRGEEERSFMFRPVLSKAAAVLVFHGNLSSIVHYGVPRCRAETCGMAPRYLISP